MTAPASRDREGFARRCGILSFVLTPVLLAIGALLLAIGVMSALPSGVAAGATVVVLAVLGLALGLAALLRSWPVDAPRHATPLVAILGAATTVTLGLVTDDNGSSMLSTLSMTGIVVSAWWVVHLLAIAVRTARRATR